MRSRVMRTAVAAIGILCGAGVATGAWATDSSTHFIADVFAPAILGMVVVGFGLSAAALRRRQPQELFA